jgi:hypothetical protein
MIIAELFYYATVSLSFPLFPDGLKVEKSLSLLIKLLLIIFPVYLSLSKSSSILHSTSSISRFAPI